MIDQNRQIIEDPERQRLMPHTEELEQIVLGAAMLDEETCGIVVEKLHPRDFYNSNLRMIFEGICKLYEKKQPIDPLTLAEELKKMKCLEEIGGEYYLSQLPNMVSSTVSADNYSDRLKAKSQLRSTIKLSAKAIDAAYRPDADPVVIIDKLQAALYEIESRGAVEEYSDMTTTVECYLDLLNRFRAAKKGVVGLPTGFYEFDRMTGGLMGSYFYIIAARPSVGKSAFVLDITRHNAEQDTSVGIFSLEMGKEWLEMRMACAKAKVNWHYKRQSDKEWEEKYKELISVSTNIHAKYPIYIDDRPGLSAMDIRRTARQMVRKNGVKLIIVDFIQEMADMPGTMNRNESVGKNGRMLKTMANEFDIPVIGVSALSRAGKDRRDPTPILSDLRESGDLEYSLDTLLFLHRPFMHKDPSKQREILNRLKCLSCAGDERDELEKEVKLTYAIVNKQRNGPTGDFELMFENKYSTFYNPAKEGEIGGMEEGGDQDDGERPF